MSLAEDIREDLKVHTGILDYITADDIHWLKKKIGSNDNCIVYKRISAPPLYDSDDQWQRWRFYINHVSEFKCKALADVLVGYLNRKDDDFDGTSIDYMECIENGDPEFIEEMKTYQAIQDYMISYH